MKVIIAGSRLLHILSNTSIAEWYAYHFADVANAMEYAEGNLKIVPTLVISGGARGFDMLGEQWAKENHIKIERRLPDYPRYGRYFAPQYRNWDMAIAAEALVAIWDGISGGTRHMIKCMNELRKPVYVHKIPQVGGSYTLATMPARQTFIDGKCVRAEG